MGYGTRIAFGALRGIDARCLLVAAVVFVCAGVASPAQAMPPQGMFVMFDVPGGSFDTVVDGINPAGAIVGTTSDGTTFDGFHVFHGFLRAPDGSFTTVDPPGAAKTGAGQINPAGVIAGPYSDASGAAHGFLFVPH